MGEQHCQCGFVGEKTGTSSWVWPCNLRRRRRPAMRFRITHHVTENRHPYSMDLHSQFLKFEHHRNRWICVFSTPIRWWQVMSRGCPFLFTSSLKGIPERLPDFTPSFPSMLRLWVIPQGTWHECDLELGTWMVKIVGNQGKYASPPHHKCRTFSR